MLDPSQSDEKLRIEDLRSFKILDTPAEQAYDDVVKLASYICDTPIALISLIDEDRQWFKARVGLPDVSETPREQALFACDELTGLITACALVRPSRALHDLTTKSVRGKWKDKAFAAGVNRADIEQGAREMNVELWQHVGNVISALQPVAAELGLTGA